MVRLHMISIVNSDTILIAHQLRRAHKCGIIACWLNTLSSTTRVTLHLHALVVPLATHTLPIPSLTTVTHGWSNLENILACILLVPGRLRHPGRFSNIHLEWRLYLALKSILRIHGFSLVNLTITRVSNLASLWEDHASNVEDGIDVFADINLVGILWAHVPSWHHASGSSWIFDITGGNHAQDVDLLAKIITILLTSRMIRLEQNPLNQNYKIGYVIVSDWEYFQFLALLLEVKTAQ